MSELKKLISMIYHEKQESGSMLCAQHALNSLLRAFAPPDDWTDLLTLHLQKEPMYVLSTKPAVNLLILSIISPVHCA